MVVCRDKWVAYHRRNKGDNFNSWVVCRIYNTQVYDESYVVSCHNFIMRRFQLLVRECVVYTPCVKFDNKECFSKPRNVVSTDGNGSNGSMVRWSRSSVLYIKKKCFFIIYNDGYTTSVRHNLQTRYL